MLSTVSGFSALRNIGGNFSIANHDSLTNTGDYPALTTIEGDFEIGGGTPEVSNDVLTALGDFSALDTIGGIIRIQNNPMLSNCSGLPASVINPSATISDNGAGCGTDATLRTQTDVTALGTALGDATLFIGNITINEPSTSTDSITDLSVFRNITEIRGSFRVSSAKSLTVLSHAISGASGEYAFGALAKITGDFLVGPYNEGAEFTTPWTSLGNFPNLSSVGDNFRVRNNTALEGISADNFPVLATVGTGFRIKNNGALETIAGFSVLSSVGGSFEINTNDILTTTGDFPVLKTIGSDFDIDHNNALESIGDFPTLRTIAGLFSVRSHDALTGLGDFSSLIAIGGNFRIGGSDGDSANDVLTTLGDFSSLGSIRGDIRIENNPMLNDCSSLPTRAINSVVNARRTISIDNNGGGCSSHSLRTQTDVDDFGTALGAATVFTGTITISGTGGTSAITDLSAFKNITEFRGNIAVSNLSQLTALSHETSAGSGEYAFNALETITGNFMVGINGGTTKFTSTGNFPNLRNIGGNFLINYNDSLTTIDADNFPALATIGENFSINNNLKLSTVSGFSALICPKKCWGKFRYTC